jgi:hypothetical protein
MITVERDLRKTDPGEGMGVEGSCPMLLAVLNLPIQDGFR